MRVTAILASPRKSGNCDILIDEAIRGAEENGAEVIKYYLDDLNMEPCHACGHCGDGIDCITQDDAAEVIESLLESDNIILATPIYFGQMTAQAKILVDRFYSVFTNPQKSFNGNALLMYTHGMPEGGLNDSIEFINGLFGTLGWNVTSLDVGEVLEPGDVKEQENKLKEAYEAGKAL